MRIDATTHVPEPPVKSSQPLDIRRDGRDIARDRRNIVHDLKDLRQDVKNGASTQQIAQDRRELYRDMREYRHDHRDLRSDFVKAYEATNGGPVSSTPTQSLDQTA